MLEDIIQLERRIQAEILEEEVRAGAWQARELEALEAARGAALAEEEHRFQQLLSDREAALEREGAALEAASAAWCERLVRLDEAYLRDVLERQLGALLPGGDDDHPHGQS